MVISTLLKNGAVKFLKILQISSFAKKHFLQIKILNQSNFFLIITTDNQRTKLQLLNSIISSVLVAITELNCRSCTVHRHGEKK